MCTNVGECYRSIFIYLLVSVAVACGHCIVNTLFSLRVIKIMLPTRAVSLSLLNVLVTCYLF